MPALHWIGKEKVINHHLEVPYRVLDRKYSYDENGWHEKNNGSKNMIIHGDNLAALKSLLPQYEGRIDCIYIDPPYNTGNQKWIYNDNVNDPRIQKWLGEVVGDDADDLAKHDKWLCMIYPRLKLLWKLLSETGTILISINDHEYANLKSVCDEIFGQKNYVQTFIWYVNGHTDNQDSITSVHEYILCYAKDKSRMYINDVVDPNTPEDSKIFNSFAENSITKNGFKNPPSMIYLPAGFPCEVKELFKEKQEHIEELLEDAEKQGYITREMTKKYSITYPARLDDMEVRDYRLQKPCRVFSGWMNNGKLMQFIHNDFKPIEDNGKLSFYLSKNGVIYYRREGRTKHYVQSILENMGTTETNKYLLEEMGIQFDYPKPIALIQYLLSVFVPPKGIVLDSFAGSGTTAHAALLLEEKPQFITIEMMDYAESSTAERIKKVIGGFHNTKGTGGNFSFYELGDTLMKGDTLNEAVSEEKIREYVYFTETKSILPERKTDEKYLLGTGASTAYYLYYEKKAITTLNRDFLHTVKTKAENYVMYADLCTLSDRELEKYHITFKKIPRDIAGL